MHDEPFVIESVDARLVLVRWTSFSTREAVEKFRDQVITQVMACKPTSVICADWRRSRVVSPEVADVLSRMMTRNNTHVERSAVLMNPKGATFGLQAERMIREAAHPGRRTFHDVPALEAFLGEVLTSAQLARVRAFLTTG